MLRLPPAVMRNLCCDKESRSLVSGERVAAEGKRFPTLLRQDRIVWAQELLRRGDVLLDDIADRLGFEDAVAFSRAS